MVIENLMLDLWVNFRCSCLFLVGFVKSRFLKFQFNEIKVLRGFVLNFRGFVNLPWCDLNERKYDEISGFNEVCICAIDCFYFIRCKCFHACLRCALHGWNGGH